MREFPFEYGENLCHNEMVVLRICQKPERGKKKNHNKLAKPLKSLTFRKG